MLAESGKKNYTVDARRRGVDIYELYSDQLKGFLFKLIGFLNADKVESF